MHSDDTPRLHVLREKVPLIKSHDYVGFGLYRGGQNVPVFWVVGALENFGLKVGLEGVGEAGDYFSQTGGGILCAVSKLYRIGAPSFI